MAAVLLVRQTGRMREQLLRLFPERLQLAVVAEGGGNGGGNRGGNGGGNRGGAAGAAAPAAAAADAAAQMMAGMTPPDQLPALPAMVAAV